MAVKIRLQRGGAAHAPHYRVVVAESSARRDGRFVEKVGTYDPCNKDAEQQVNLNLERIDYWLGVGAKPTDTTRSIIKRARREAPKAEEVAAPAEAEASSEA
jgi:small subunit ribosomal protein S16